MTIPPKSISIIGSTGSVGRQVLEVVDQDYSRFNIKAMGCYGNHPKRFAEQAERYRPEIVAVTDGGKAESIRKELARRRLDIDVLEGEKGIIEIAKYEHADAVVTSLVGVAGLKPTYEAIRSGADIYLANKETLVTAGSLIMKEAEKHDVRIIPLDDEMVGIYECVGGMERERLKHVEKVLLSCSGGPFRGKDRKYLSCVTAEEALNHPKFKMGPKISTESALLWNKGAEVIQTKYLFDFDADQIDVFVHPEAIIHAAVQFTDGNLLTANWPPATKYAIAWALFYPERAETNFERADLFKLRSLSFERPDTETFPCLEYAYEALRKGGTMPAATYFASDIATDLFIEGKTGFIDVERAIKNTLDNHVPMNDYSLNDILNLEKDVKKKAAAFLGMEQES